MHFLIEELKGAVVGSRVEKLHQTAKDELVLYLRSRSGSYKLLLSANANSPRLNLTDHAPENPKKPTMLCMLFRKHLQGAVITDIQQTGLDRCVKIFFDGTNEIGDRVKLFIYLEIMAKHSNIILTDGGGKIIDSVKRVDALQSSVRQVLPGLEYSLPPQQDKLDIRTETVDLICDKILLNKNKTVSGAVLSTLQGTSPLLCRELSHRCCSGDIIAGELNVIEIQGLKKTIAALKSMVNDGSPAPVMLKCEDGKPHEFCFMDITQYGNLYSKKSYDSFSLLLDDFYYEKDRLDRTRQRAADLIRTLNSATLRISKKLSARQAEFERCADKETLRISAELINANLHRLEKGCYYYDLENYYDNNNIMRIKADPALSPKENAQKYYKEYKKAKTAEQLLVELIDASEQELQYIETVSDALSRTDTQSEINEIREELVQQGFVKNRTRGGESKKSKPLPPLKYISSDGFAIYVGRNNIQNDKLSLKTAKGGDLWLHTQKIPGSHVIISAENRQIPDSTIEQAAIIAAYHSRARQSALVPVDYTPAKNLKKPNGAKPGKVIYHVYNTVIVNPDREKVESLSAE
ncbi:MAG: NFACT family protein [Clostridiales bacterium]|nr:NFACT family protein [Clostridiales bacterium]